MIKNSSQNRGCENWKVIDFLEDSAFRSWVLNSGDMQGQDEQLWEEQLRNNSQARKARYILEALKMHFDKVQMSNEEIEVRLEQEIDKYRHSSEGKGWHLFRTGWWKAAAAIALLVGLFFLIQWMSRPFDVYTTGFGEQLTIELPDQSTIQLNSNSRLIWDRQWEKSGNRNVQLEGEAFFDIENRDGIPFNVSTGDITVHVTGTQFNVNSRRNRSTVYLDEGKVNVEIRNRPNERYEMEPGEELVYQALEDKVEQKRIEAPEEISGWKEGMLVFRDEPLMKVLESISDIYGKEFILKDTALISRNITTTIPLTNWDVSLAAIQLAMRLDVEIQNDTVRIKERQ